MVPTLSLPYQRGQVALITILLMLGVGAAAFVYTLATPSAMSLDRDKKTAVALAMAKEALIGYAAADNRPGSLPCPDVTNNGSAGSPFPIECPGHIPGNSAYIGRLPWRTLGLPDLRDGNGERLWYAVSRDYAINSSSCGSCPLNSETAGFLRVTTNSALLENVIAIVFAPGTIVPSQDRSSTNENKVEHYLEGGNQLNDRLTGTPPESFKVGGDPAQFNDKLLSITRDSLFPIVEMRVARELRNTLRDYYGEATLNNRYYPYAAPFPGGACATGTYRGYVPISGCPPLATLTLPSWFTDNDWDEVMVYAVAPRCTPGIIPGYFSGASSSGCTFFCCGLWWCPPSIDSSTLQCNNTTIGSYLTVTGLSNSIRSLVFSASYRQSTQSGRPCNTISDCLESVNGNDENIGTDNYVYVKPVRSATNNDNLIIVSP